MQFKNFLLRFIFLTMTLLPNAWAEAKHFDKIMIIMFENMSFPEIQNQPVFKKLISHTQKKAKVNKLSDPGYALFNSYYNNHNGGIIPTRSSQPNYFAITSGSTHGIVDNDIHDLDVDNLAMELIDANITWKVYAEDLPDPKNGKCFTDKVFPSDNGYKRKHEPFISYLNIQTNFQHCKNLVNSKHLLEDLDHDMPTVSFYIPNQINDGHNGNLWQRTRQANAFLAKMMGMDAKTGELLPDAARAPLQKFISQGGLAVITFDEPSTTGNSNKTIYTLFAGNMVKNGNFTPICYPSLNEQNRYPKDAYGDYAPTHCNHYNLLKMIESNYGLRGLEFSHTSSGYKYAYSLDNNISSLWR